MARTSDVSQALATLQARWGAAAPRRWGEVAPEVRGALAMAPEPASEDADVGVVPSIARSAPPSVRTAAPDPEADGRVVSTGFAALDAVLGTGGLPRSATVALRGDATSGKTTLALRVAAEAQAAGSIVAWLDLARAFDPVEAVARGVSPDWLVVLTPADLAEALSLAGSLLAARTVDLLVLDLPDGRDPAVARARVGDRLGRLAALARRAGTLLLVLESSDLGRTLAATVEEASGLRLELRRSGWIRLGRDVVGQRSVAEVARNRYGPPGRSAELQILYAEGGPRDGCLARPGLLDGLPGTAPSRPALASPGLAPAGLASPASPTAPAAPPGLAAAPPGPPPGAPPGPALLADRKGPHASTDPHAPAVSPLAAPAPPPRPGPSRAAGERRQLRLVAVRPDRPRRSALDGRDGAGCGSARPGARRPAGDPAGDRPSPGARGGVPGPVA
jgi:RecA/RadA recombinase